MSPAVPENAGARLSRVGQIAVGVENLERAVAFYRDILGLQFLFQAPPGLAFFDCGGVRLMLSAGEGDGGRAPTSILYYVVGDIQEAHRSLTERGVRFEAQPHMIARLPDHDLWMAFLKDSEQNLLGLMSEVRPPGKA